MKKPFNPDDFDTTQTVEEIAKKFAFLNEIDFSKSSLNDELVKLNYEIISGEYEDLAFSDIKEYFHFEVDEIV